MRPTQFVDVLFGLVILAACVAWCVAAARLFGGDDK